VAAVTGAVLGDATAAGAVVLLGLIDAVGAAAGAAAEEHALKSEASPPPARPSPARARRDRRVTPVGAVFLGSITNVTAPPR